MEYEQGKQAPLDAAYIGSRVDQVAGIPEVVIGAPSMETSSDGLYRGIRVDELLRRLGGAGPEAMVWFGVDRQATPESPVLVDIPSEHDITLPLPRFLGGRLILNLAGKYMLVDEHRVPLTPGEASLLRTLVEFPDQAVRAEAIAIRAGAGPLSPEDAGEYANSRCRNLSAKFGPLAGAMHREDGCVIFDTTFRAGSTTQRPRSRRAVLDRALAARLDADGQVA